MYPRIKDLRDDKEINQTDIANVLGCSQRAYSHYERGDSDIPTDILIKLAKYYKTTTDYLLGLTDNPRRPG